ncbi:MAG: ATP phosphoribosyltransferase regulatory subunit [Lachnospiraceae bacterium]|nr:ATP phosphoribosyltransferase regulatory subunit [Lachnospiraceae bacterium]
MRERLLHTPEGVRDIYGAEYAGKIRLQEQLTEQFHLYGYEEIQTPTFEFFDIFSSNIGTIPSRELYKFFDKEGNTLVLRPDFTPSIARCVAKYYMDENMPIRFCYLGNTFANVSDLQGRLKESTQVGVELINDDSASADAEMIALMIKSLKRSGLKEFQITVGNVEFFKGLCEECGIDAETEMDVRDTISNKNYFGAEQILLNRSVSDEIRMKILRVTELFGSLETVLQARSFVKNKRSLDALLRLEQIHEILKTQDLDRYLTYDVGMLSKYHYYTGVIFKAYAYGCGDALMKGGRYDNLLSEFGKDASAIGFAIVVDDLYQTIRRVDKEEKTHTKAVLLLFDETSRKEAYREADNLREKKVKTIMMQRNAHRSKEEYQSYAARYGYELREV